MFQDETARVSGTLQETIPPPGSLPKAVDDRCGLLHAVASLLRQSASAADRAGFPLAVLLASWRTLGDEWRDGDSEPV